MSSLRRQEDFSDDPDVIVGCTGGGSNFAGISFPFIGQQLRGGGKTKKASAKNKSDARKR